MKGLKSNQKTTPESTESSSFDKILGREGSKSATVSISFYLGTTNTSPHRLRKWSQGTLGTWVAQACTLVHTKKRALGICWWERTLGNFLWSRKELTTFFVSWRGRGGPSTRQTRCLSVVVVVTTTKGEGGNEVWLSHYASSHSHVQQHNPSPHNNFMKVKVKVTTISTRFLWICPPSCIICFSTQVVGCFAIFIIVSRGQGIFWEPRLAGWG